MVIIHNEIIKNPNRLLNEVIVNRKVKKFPKIIERAENSIFLKTFLNINRDFMAGKMDVMPIKKIIIFLNIPEKGNKNVKNAVAKMGILLIFCNLSKFTKKLKIIKADM